MTRCELGGLVDTVWSESTVRLILDKNDEYESERSKAQSMAISTIDVL